MVARNVYRTAQLERQNHILGQHALTLLVVALYLTTSSGCIGSVRYYPITGRVVTAEEEINSSYMLNDIILAPGEGYHPVAGAKAFLAYDEHGKKPVPDCEAKTDEKGLFKLETKDIKRSADGWYFLVIEKEGYEPVNDHMSPGPCSSSLQNTVILKPIPKK